MTIVFILGLYCTGWVSTGPVGVILNTMNQAFETGKVVLKDITDGKLDLNKPGGHMVMEKLKDKGRFMFFEKRCLL